MKIILSPAKKMKTDTDTMQPIGLPVYLDETARVLAALQGKSPAELKALWKCNDKIAAQNITRLQEMDLRARLTPAVLAYEGIAYQYMAPAVFEAQQFAYIQSHLRILSAFYGVLSAMDGVTPYRLEMQSGLAVGDAPNLYDFWGSRLYRAVRDDSGTIINLASKEYAKCVEKHITPADRFITITFCELSGGKLVTKGTYAKMARGEMVRYMAEHQITDPEDIKGFDRLGFRCRDDLSSPTEFVFQRHP
ncbi:MAG: peroxide stress protein YaaA [Clostridia bacterium]|nr:peroxide stress protein YaaA [Clostridia bacterium]